MITSTIKITIFKHHYIKEERDNLDIPINHSKFPITLLPKEMEDLAYLLSDSEEEAEELLIALRKSFRFLGAKSFEFSITQY